MNNLVLERLECIFHDIYVADCSSNEVQACIVQIIPNAKDARCIHVEVSF